MVWVSQLMTLVLVARLISSSLICHLLKLKQSIIRSMCTLSKSLHINLVSEGVEDDATWKLMQSLGVDVCQGYLTGRPMPIEALSLFDVHQH